MNAARNLARNGTNQASIMLAYGFQTLCRALYRLLFKLVSIATAALLCLAAFLASTHHYGDAFHVAGGCLVLVLFMAGLRLAAYPPRRGGEYYLERHY